MKNKDLKASLKRFPDDADVVLEAFFKGELKYFKINYAQLVEFAEYMGELKPVHEEDPEIPPGAKLSMKVLLQE